MTVTWPKSDMRSFACMRHHAARSAVLPAAGERVIPSKIFALARPATTTATPPASEATATRVTARRAPHARSTGDPANHSATTVNTSPIALAGSCRSA